MKVCFVNGGQIALQFIWYGHLAVPVIWHKRRECLLKCLYWNCAQIHMPLPFSRNPHTYLLLFGDLFHGWIDRQINVTPLNVANNIIWELLHSYESYSIHFKINYFINFMLNRLGYSNKTSKVSDAEET